mmetsp:Transcript_23799/g.56858  ORF Transcript_23799/g.56858 Transcript_23799/m.56858 type:complete len:111 (+) Transcript_23799:55-387(+)|eukprot:1051717-Rhodomonas_salina.2
MERHADSETKGGREKRCSHPVACEETERRDIVPSIAKRRKKCPPPVQSTESTGAVECDSSPDQPDFGKLFEFEHEHVVSARAQDVAKSVVSTTLLDATLRGIQVGRMDLR